jgi:16S rRNA (guanine527-N7)-methyltransferase
LADKSFGEKLEEATDVLITGSKILGVAISSYQVDHFLSYISLLLQWNNTFNLTSISDPVTIVRLHFLDSLAIAPFLDKSGPLMDIGSGAGFPGMPLKISFPEMSITLVEPRRKRANFLRALIRRIQAKGVNVIEGRIEHVSNDLAGLFSTVALRAVGNPQLFLSAAKTLLKAAGKCLIMHGPKGKILFSDVRDLALREGFPDARIESYTIPLGKESRTLLVLSR